MSRKLTFTCDFASFLKSARRKHDENGLYKERVDIYSRKSNDRGHILAFAKMLLRRWRNYGSFSPLITLLQGQKWENRLLAMMMEHGELQNLARIQKRHTRGQKLKLDTPISCNNDSLQRTTIRVTDANANNTKWKLVVWLNYLDNETWRAT